MINIFCIFFHFVFSQTENSYLVTKKIITVRFRSQLLDSTEITGYFRDDTSRMSRCKSSRIRIYQRSRYSIIIFTYSRLSPLPVEVIFYNFTRYFQLTRYDGKKIRLPFLRSKHRGGGIFYTHSSLNIQIDKLRIYPKRILLELKRIGCETLYFEL